jgi:hypothetical protein
MVVDRQRLVLKRETRKNPDFVRGYDFKLTHSTCLEEHETARHFFILSRNDRLNETYPRRDLLELLCKSALYVIYVFQRTSLVRFRTSAYNSPCHSLNFRQREPPNYSH